MRPVTSTGYRSFMGAPVGNQFAHKARIWTDAIKRALEHRSKGDQIKALDDLAEKLLQQCDIGDMVALKELGDRLEGKPMQVILGSGENGEVVVKWLGS